MSRGFPIPSNKENAFQFPHTQHMHDTSFSRGWNPDQIPNIVSYWDNGLPYMTLDGSVWYDRIGSRHFKNIGAAPAVYTTNFINGLPAYVTNGVSDIRFQTAMIPEISNAPGCTVWMAGQKYMFSQDDGQAAGLNRYSLTQFTDGNVYNIISNNKYGSYNFGTAPSFTVFIFDGRGSTDSARVITWTNGIQRTLSFISPPMPFYTDGTLGVFAKLQWQLTSGKLNGNICECGIIARAINPNEIFALNIFLSKRYNL